MATITKKTRALSTRQKRMAQLMAAGDTAVSAYAEAGYTGDPERKACQVVENSGFKKHLDSLMAKGATKAVKTRAERMEALSRVMDRTEEEKPDTMIRASDQLNKLTGEYAPERFKAEVTLTPVETMMTNLRLYDTIEAPSNDRHS